MTEDKRTDQLVRIKSHLLDVIDALNLLIDPPIVDGEIGAVIDPLAHLRAMESIVGLEEVKDRDALMEKFQRHGIDIDPSKIPWCGVAVRYAVCEAGYDDPGEEMHLAINWEDYGQECDANEPGAILVHHSHVGIRTEDGKEIGGNVGKRGKGTTKVGDDNWFGPVVAARKPV